MSGDLSAGAGVHIPVYTRDAAPARAGPNQVPPYTFHIIML